MKHWTDEEKKYLVKNYGKKEIEKISKHLKKSENAIYIQASTMQLVSEDNWTDAEIAQLKKIFPKTGNKIVAEKIGKSISAIRSKAFQLKIKKSDHYWKNSDENFVLKNWETLSPVEIGNKINKTKWAVINKYRELTGKRSGFKKLPVESGTSILKD